MPSMKRRHFLQFSGSALAALGLSQTNFLRQANHYGSALAQSTPRKLALLVGINQYPDQYVSSLSGCLNDVEMQYQLLVNRFGFKPSDVLMVTDDSALQPTRANILEAFEEHLIKQAKPGDVVVFHYSGHGSLVNDPSPIRVAQCGQGYAAGLNGTLVPRDVEFGSEGSDIVVPDIMGRSLFLLTERINTDSVTLVLDSCFSGAGTRGNARVRSATSSRLTSRDGVSLVASAEELEQQQRWMQDLELDEAEFQQRRSQGIAKGVALGSASCDQEAYELPYDNGKVAGAFTYLLTSYLWQTPAPKSASDVKVDLVRSTQVAVARSRREEQVPIFEQAPSSNNLAQPFYFVDALAPFADAVVKSVTGDQVELWLGGVSYQNLETVRKGTVYTLVAPNTDLGEIVVESRSGLLAYGNLSGTAAALTPGMLLREKLLAIPTPTLRIGVDASLAAEQAAAEAALQTVLQPAGRSDQALITVLPVNQQSNLEFVLARTTEAVRSQLRQPAPSVGLPPLGTVALYSDDLTSFVPNTAGAVNESATAAVNRMEQQLRRLLVIRTLQSLTGMASDLQVSGEIFTTSGQGPVVALVSRGSQGRSQPQAAGYTYQTGEVFEITLQNAEPSEVYLSALAIDSAGEIIVLHPAGFDDPDAAALVEGSSSLTVPRQQDGIRLRFAEAGLLEIITIVSQKPLRGLLQALKAIAENPSRGSQGPVGFDEGNPLALIDTLLGDIDDISRSVSVEPTAVSESDTAVDSGAIAAFSTVIEIVD
ncbi:MAG: caspase family protein [Nodosilinea sp.]